MTRPSGWREPGQTPEFDEYTLVVHGEFQAETRDATRKVAPDKRSSSMAGNGCDTVRPMPKARHMLRSVYRRFHRRPCTETLTSIQQLKKSRCNENSNHGERHGNLQRRADNQADGGADAGARRLPQVAAG